MVSSPPALAHARECLRAGGLRGAELLAWLRAHPARERDAAFEHLLGIDGIEPHPPLGPDLVGYVPSGIAPIVRAVLDVPILASDVFVDLGAGLGKVVMAVHLLSGARARGIELQPALCAHARERAHALALDGVGFEVGDAREAELAEANVFFLYLPFTNGVLAAAMARIAAVAKVRRVVVCTLGFDLRGVAWLRERPTDSFWLSIYESEPGVGTTRSPLFGSIAEDVARER